MRARLGAGAATPARWLSVALVACTTSPHAAHEEKTVSPAPRALAGETVPAVASPRVLSLAAKSGSPTTLVVMLHGVGADAASFHDVAKALAPGFPDVEFVTPDGFEPFDRAPTGRQWFSLDGVTEANRAARVRGAGAEVSRWIDGELARRRLGRERLVVIGFSQGAMVASWLAVHRAPPPAAVVLFSGLVADDEAPIADAVATPVFLAHGAEDARIPVSEVEPGARTLGAWGAKVTQRIYPGLGHRIDRRELEDADAFLRATLSSP